jgi:uncharacterized protein (DUF427 family)
MLTGCLELEKTQTFPEVDMSSRVRIEPGHKRVRVYLGGELIADSTKVKLVWEKPYYPTYFIPQDDVSMQLLTPTDHTKHSPSRGEAKFFTVKGGTATAENAAYHHPDSPIAGLSGHIAFVWEAMDAWFEEDEEVFVHARDPYTRVDVLASSRHIQIVVDGTTVADSHHPRLLFETGLPTRYYLPKTDVRMDLLSPTATQTHCPYKGTAQYWSIDINGGLHEDIVWGYRTPVQESSRIAGLVSFYNEKVDVYVDGVLQDRPKTMFS